MIPVAERPQVGLRQDSSSAGRRFAPYTAQQILQQLTPLVASAGPAVCAMCAKFVTRFQFLSGPSHKTTVTRWDPSPLQKWAYRGAPIPFRQLSHKSPPTYFASRTVPRTPLLKLPDLILLVSPNSPPFRVTVPIRKESR